MSTNIHKYTNGEVTVIWQPNLCHHSAKCFKGLPGVFDPRRRPWIDMSQSNTRRIIEQVKICPSGALSFEINSVDPPNSID